MLSKGRAELGRYVRLLKHESGLQVLLAVQARRQQKMSCEQRARLLVRFQYLF
jgi:hypothetical protein